VKGTKLWNQPRSPLIQGRSRRERPFWTDWLSGAVVAIVIGAVVAVAVLVPRSVGVTEWARILVLPVAAGAGIGSATGVWLAAAFGWHPRWVAGGIFGSTAAILATWVAIALGAAPG